MSKDEKLDVIILILVPAGRKRETNLPARKEYSRNEIQPNGITGLKLITKYTLPNEREREGRERGESIIL